MALGARCAAAVPGSRGPGPASGPVGAASRGGGAGPGRPVCRGQPAQRAASVRSCGADAWARQRYWHALPDGREGRAYQEFLAPRRPLLAWSYATCPVCCVTRPMRPDTRRPPNPARGCRTSPGMASASGISSAPDCWRPERSSSAQVTKAIPPTGSGPAAGPPEEDAGAHPGRALRQVRG